VDRLRNGFAAKGQVRLYGAEIGGNLDCTDGKFKNPTQLGSVGSGIALEAAIAKVAGAVVFHSPTGNAKTGLLARRSERSRNEAGELTSCATRTDDVRIQQTSSSSL
jgi:hypothetical protein